MIIKINMKLIFIWIYESMFFEFNYIIGKYNSNSCRMMLDIIGLATKWYLVTW